MAQRYPDELAHSAKTLSGFSKNLVKLSTQTLLDANPNDFIVIKICENQLVRMNSLSIHFDLVGYAATNDHCVLPRETNSYFDQVFWECNGVLLDGSCTAYNHLAKIHTDFLGENRRSARSVLNLGRDYVNRDGTSTVAATDARPFARIGYSAASPTATVGVPIGTTPTIVSDPRSSSQNAHACALNNFIGFGGLNKIIDTSILGELKLILKVAPSTIAMGDTTHSFQLKNIRAYVEVMDVQDNTYYRSIQEVLQNGALTIPFKKYYSVFSPEQTGSGSIRASISTQSLDAVYVMFLKKTSDSDYRDNPTTANQVAPAFKRLSTNISNLQMDVSSCLYPQFAVSVQDAYYLLQNTLGLTANNTTGSLAELSPVTWVNDLCLWSNRFNFAPGVDAPKSGIDSRGVSLSVVANVNATGSVGGMPLMLLETTAWLNIGAFRAISITN